MTRSVRRNIGPEKRDKAIVPIAVFDQSAPLDLRHLVALCAVSDAGTFRAAAEKLGYSQAGISAQIAALERQVGCQLVVRPRGRGRVVLTQAGKSALHHANALIARSKAARADIAASADRQRLRVGTFQSAGAWLLPPILERYAQDNPRVGVELTERPIDTDLLRLLEDGELDLSFVMLPLPPGPFGSVTLLQDTYALLVPADHPLAKARRGIEADEFTEFDLIAASSCRSTARAETALRQRCERLRVVHRSDDNETIRAMVRAELGLALVPRLLAVPNERDLVLIDLAFELPTRRIGLAWQAQRQPTDTGAWFVEVAQDVSRTVETVMVSASRPRRKSKGGRITARRL